MGYRDYSIAKGHIVDSTGHGDFTTISAALAAAISGETIFVRPGIYTENPTAVAGVSISALSSDAFTPTVTLIGKLTYSGSGTVSISGIKFQTNSDFAIVVSGSNASGLSLTNCSIICTNHTGISYTCSNSSSTLFLFCCTGNTGLNSVAYITDSSPGLTAIEMCFFSNSAASTAANTSSDGDIIIANSNFPMALSFTSTGAASIVNSNIDNSLNNVTCVTTAGTGTTTISQCYFASGSASAFNIGSGSEVNSTNITLSSNNTNAITGTGTLDAAIITFTGSSHTINGTLTVNKYTVFGGTII